MCMYEKQPQFDITFTKYHISGMDFTHTHTVVSMSVTLDTLDS